MPSNDFIQNAELVLINDATIARVEKWIGLGGKGKGRLHHYLKLESETDIVEEFKKLLLKQAMSQQGYETTKKAIRQFMDSNIIAKKALEDCYYDLASDLHSQIDRCVANQNAIKLDLNFAIYEGGIGCSHHFNWIPYTLAVFYRPDLAGSK